MKCLRSLVRVSRMNKVRNKYVRRGAGIWNVQLSSRVDEGVLRWI